VRHNPRHVALAALASLLAGCGNQASQTDAAFELPAGDPDGGTVTGTITTNLTGVGAGQVYVAAFSPDLPDGGPLVAVLAGPAVFPVHYALVQFPAGRQVIRAFLDLPPYAGRPTLDPPGPEDATGVYLNSTSIVPVAVRPGAVTSRVDFFITR
jgi:hypothetical protein